MSWNAPPLAGAPSPYPHGQPAFGQPQTYQQGQQSNQNSYQPTMYNQSSIPPRPPESRPPKKKGNPIITKYPPPPGYQGPAQPRGPFGTMQQPVSYQQYPSAQQPYPQAPPTPTGYPTQGYQAPSASHGYAQHFGPPPIQTQMQPPAYAQPGYQPTPTHQWPQPQQNYQQQPPQAQSYPQVQNYAPAQGMYQGYPTPITPASQSQPWASTPTWQQPSAPPPYSMAGTSNPSSTTSVNAPSMPGTYGIPTPTSAYPTAAQNTPISAHPPSAASEFAHGEQEPLNLALYDWDFDFDGAIWPKASEPVDPNFSLGQIVWHPADQVTRALPSVAAEAQKQADDPPAKKLGNAESVSIYFTTENSHEAFLDVRQTDDWDKVKNDPVFVVFTDEMMAELIPTAECIALRDRPDGPVEEVDTSREQDEAMHGSSWDVMNDLEKALSSTAEDSKPPTARLETSRSTDQAQEDILAKLGVTGKPKTPSGEIVSLPYSFSSKPPASLPPKPPAPPPPSLPSRAVQPLGRANSYGGHHNFTHGTPASRPYGSVSSTNPALPDARNSEPRRSDSLPKPPKGHNLDGARESPRSDGSNHTMAGSDFDPEKQAIGIEQSADSIPQLKRSDSSSARKRSYEDTDYDDPKTRQPDDHARRKRRSQVAAAYSRR